LIAFSFSKEKNSILRFLAPFFLHSILNQNGLSRFSKDENIIYNPQFEQGTPYEQRSGKQKTENDNSSVRSKIEQIVTKNEGVRYPVSIIEFSKNKTSYHPTQKPVELLEYLVKTYSNEGDTILDFTAGSGTTGIACMNTNRKCILIEKEEKYCELIKDRLVNEFKQIILF
jgi:site-specific DNA-methyltransferase (adenine-specific)